MSAGAGPLPRAESAPSVLIVEDDRRVLELIEIAYSSHGFRTMTAVDGHDAMQKVLTDKPDLLVLDVRLPKKSGLEVCEMLRRDPEEHHLPIIIVSASGDTDARLRGFIAGADDYVAKPFSPRELIARSRRLLIRAGEGRDLRARVTGLERDLGRAQDEVKRSVLETRREQRLRDLATTLARAFHRELDLDRLARHILTEAQVRFGVGMAGLLVRDETAGAFVPRAVRGDGLDRLAGLEFPLESALAHLLPALGRPAMVREIERLSELATDVPALVAARIARIAPLSGPAGLAGLLVTDERLDGLEPTRAELEMLSVLCETAGVALHVAARLRAQIDLELELVQPAPGRDDTFDFEAAGVVERAARATLLPPQLRSLLAHGIRLRDLHNAEENLTRLARLADEDPTGRVAELMRLIEASRAPREESEPPDWRRAAALLAIGAEMAEARRAGLAPAAALARACERDPSLDPATAQALAAAVRESAWLAGTPA